LLPDQVVRKRECAECGHGWFTVEAEVNRFAIGWSTEYQNKPVLREAVTLKLGFVPQLPAGPKPGRITNCYSRNDAPPVVGDN
jgi:hypothetical protein